MLILTFIDHCIWYSVLKLEISNFVILFFILFFQVLDYGESGFSDKIQLANCNPNVIPVVYVVHYHSVKESSQ